MIRSCSSQRTLKWIKRNNIIEEGCLNFVKKILGRYGIIDYEIDGENLKIDRFVLSIDKEKVCLRVFEIGGKYRAEFFGDTCWMRAIQEIEQRIYQFS